MQVCPVSISRLQRFSTALSDYKLQTLISIKHQARKVMLVWVIVFLALLGVAFTLKIGEVLSRGATLGFLVVGLVFLFVWRSTLERVLQKAMANGTFAKQRTMFIGDKVLLSASQVMDELRRYGYQPKAILESIQRKTQSVLGTNKFEVKTIDVSSLAHSFPLY